MTPQKRKILEQTHSIPLSAKDDNCASVSAQISSIKHPMEEGDFHIHRCDISDLPGGRIFLITQGKACILGTFANIVEAANYLDGVIK